MMPRLRRTRERVVVPLATNEPSPVVQELSINAPSVSAEMVVHCEDSTERRAPPSMVVEKTQHIGTDEPSSCGLHEQPEKNNPIPAAACHCGSTGPETREEIMYPSSPTDEVTHLGRS